MVNLKKFFSKQEKIQKEENPYISARRTWNDNLNSLISSRLIWQFTAFLMGTVALISTTGLVLLMNRSQYIPFIVNVDKLGQTHSIGPLQQNPQIEERVLKATIHNFIEKTRLVTADTYLQRNAILQVFAHLQKGTPALTKILRWFDETSETNPFKRATKELVSVQINSILALSENSWQVSWTENTNDHNGNTIALPLQMRAIVSIEIVPPNNNTTEQQLYLNPLGIFIKDFSWARVT